MTNTRNLPKFVSADRNGKHQESSPTLANRFQDYAESPEFSRQSSIKQTSTISKQSSTVPQKQAIVRQPTISQQIVFSRQQTIRKPSERNNEQKDELSSSLIITQPIRSEIVALA